MFGLFATSVEPRVAELISSDTMGEEFVDYHEKASRTLTTILDHLIMPFVRGETTIALDMVRRLARARREFRKNWLKMVGATEAGAVAMAENLVPRADAGVGAADVPDGATCHLCWEALHGTTVSCRESHAHRPCVIEHCARVLQSVYNQDVVLCPCGCKANVFVDLTARHQT